MISEKLVQLINKPPVVATHVGSFADSENAARTLARYTAEANTHVYQPALQQYHHKFLGIINDSNTAIGCLVAPFGYGKTSAAVGIWHACAQHGILAVPPFSCNSIAEMGQAIASGLRYQLSSQPEAVASIEAAYQSYLVSSAQRLAQDDAERFEVPYSVALKSIEDKIARGLLTLEASGTHLLVFLEQLTAIVQKAGYRGLVILVDEFQQFLANLSKAVITNFRTLVWGLRTRGALPLGLLITMDPDTERNLTERAGDILHRIKEDGLYLDFSAVYDREFPRQLWSRYAEQYAFNAESRQIFDNATLEALGQMCERADLSNGPRTVIDVFQRAATLFGLRQRPYSPMDLIDDFMTGDIRFDGDRSKVASLVTELSSYDFIKRVPDRYRVFKLIAAFPRGCPREVAKAYNLADAYDYLADALRGEVLVELPEGIALIDLQQVGKPQNKLNIILKKYWMQITEAELVADRATWRFAEYAVNPLFPPFGNSLSGWRRLEKAFTLTETGSYVQFFEGTFFEEYPLRRVCVQVCRDESELASFTEYFDAHLIFFLHTNDSALPAAQFDPESRTLRMHVALMKPFERALPRDVAWIGDYLRPVVMTPGVLLSLLHYIDQQVGEIEGMSEGERQRIADHQRKLQSYLVGMTFGEELFNLPEFKLISRGEQALRDVLFALFRRAYPQYQTLITSPQWESYLKSYQAALKEVNPIIGRGLAPLQSAKAEIAALFGLRSHAGFESQAKQYAPLLKLETWAGTHGEVVFQRHPGEDAILRLLNASQQVDSQSLYAAVRRLGYLVEETEYLIQFLILRGFLEDNAAADTYRLAQTLSAAELTDLAQNLTRELDVLACFGQDRRLDNLKEQVAHFAAEVNAPDADLVAVQVRLLQAEREIRTERNATLARAQQQLTQSRANLHTAIAQLQKALPEATSGLALDTHLNGAQRTLAGDAERVVKRLQALTDALQKQLETPPHAETFESVQTFEGIYRQLQAQTREALEGVQNLQQKIAQHQSMVRLVEQLGRQYGYLATVQQVTNSAGLQRDLDNIKDALQTQLATVGLASYASLLATYTPQIERIGRDVNTALAAEQLRRATPPAARPVVPSAAVSEGSVSVEPLFSMAPLKAPPQLSARERLLALAAERDLTLAEIMRYLAVPPESLLRLLVELETEGIFVLRSNHVLD
ncbi:MAG: hypothetical protein OHK0023_12630 [Anaerolineae bacterium]